MHTADSLVSEALAEDSETAVSIGRLVSKPVQDAQRVSGRFCVYPHEPKRKR